MTTISLSGIAAFAPAIVEGQMAVAG